MQLTQAIECARSRGWLATCPPHVQKDLIREMRLIELAADRYLFRATDQIGGIYSVASGAIKAMSYSETRGEMLAHLVSMPGVWFGQGPAVLRQPRTLSFRAAGPVELLHITLADMDRVSRISVDHMRALATLTELGMHEVIAIVESLLIPGASQRIAATLLRVAYGAAGPEQVGSVTIILTQAELGEMANASRNMVSRTLKQLETKGWIGIGYGTLTIMDPECVRAFSTDQH